METNHVIAEFHITCRNEMHEKLNSAVAAAQVAALSGGAAGVLVTRHDFNRFSVALSPEVPYGTTREHDQANRN